MRPLLLALALTLPTAAFSVSTPDTTTPPVSSPHSDCPDGQVWNLDEGQCELAQTGRHSDETLFVAVRELAYIGRHDSAEIVLSAMSNPLDDRVLTYRGFLARMQGDLEGARAWYLAALGINPDNLLVRSYMGMGLVAEGDLAGARAQLDEIRTRGGQGTWAEVALAEAISTGRTTLY